MREITNSKELKLAWSQSHEEKSTLSVVLALIQGFICTINVIFGYYILIHYYDQLLLNMSIMKILLFTLIGELFIYLNSVIFMFIVRFICGIRSSANFLSVISVLNLLSQLIFYYLCFIVSLTIVIFRHLHLQFGSSSLLSNFLIDKKISASLTQYLTLYFSIEALVSSIEVIPSLPIFFRVLNYGISKEIDKLRGKPIVEFYSTNEPITYTLYQDYDRAFENLNNYRNSDTSYIPIS
ncbi:putative integral membrane protein [Cryptosporidium felis]|nr:putative integral membrane protein [Cryptosporidium felis]